ncbi:NRDE family protein [Limnobacter parvus]|uniref:NRDE family protein n=1 Tax=Limnobacter parvus TaxID=2939690 RepID=A0ABT1XI24_9BURK|nr:NRDE family protein [Limnobacter parvus]MCR2746930.1 NRDE family protein [Limnobacter parvus]
MCLAAVALNAHPDFPFICVANRDEFHNRPTAPLHVWNSTMVAGKDLQSGGAWLGVGTNSEFALLTNVRNSALNMPATAPTRGELVVNSIATGKGPSKENALGYAGFNLIHGNLNSLVFSCTSNQGLKLQNDLPFTVSLNQGIHSLSNGHFGAPWPKTRKLEAGLKSQLETPNTQAITIKELESALFDLLANTSLAADDQLPSTGVPYEWEKMLSAVKIVSPLYGTRSSAVVLLDHNNTVHFTEITFNPAGNESGQQRFEIPLPPKL